MITGFYAGLLGLWLVFLILSVVALRRKYRVGLGDGGEKELSRAIRVHGNFTETVPLVLILMGAMEYAAALPPAGLHVYGAALVLSRVLHWHGISRSSTVSFGRTVGTVIVTLLLAAGALVMFWSFVRGL